MPTAGAIAAVKGYGHHSWNGTAVTNTFLSAVSVLAGSRKG
jgi:hypothetical protein